MFDERVGDGGGNEQEDGVLDLALERLEDRGPEFNNGFSSHGPMVAEVLVALGRTDEVLPWVDGYVQHLNERPAARQAIDRKDFRRALGDFDRFADWALLFERELKERAWQEVLNAWVPRLVPGLAAGITHGVIRTAHAVRAIARQETPPRRRELARGLAYWASRYHELPGEFSGQNGELLPSQALERVELLPPAQRKPFTLIVERLAGLEGFESFAHVMDLVDTSIDPSRFISDLTETFSHVYLMHATDYDVIITFIHTVTAPSALRLLAPYLDRETIPFALRTVWQVDAGLFAVFGQTRERASLDPSFDAAPAQVGELIEQLIDRAVATRHVHVIKFVESCLREYAVEPRPVYLAAAYDAVERLEDVTSGPHIPVGSRDG